MQNPCRQCNAVFEISANDVKFYDEISPVFGGKKYLIPAPSLCPDCRMQRRNAWRNERKFYKRTCDLCKKTILAMYDSNARMPVYCLDCWWSDDWDAMQYGRDFDFSRSFFEQFDDLRNQVPHFSLSVLHSTMENSDYCNHAGFLKNCYLLFNSDTSEKCMYGKGINRCFDCIDCFKVYDCQACYEAINCNNCSFSTFLLDSYNCDSCHFSANLVGCRNCFGCVNLRNKEYYFFNEKLTREEYEKRVSEIRKKPLEHIQAKFLNFRAEQVAKWMQEKNTENCTGEYLVNSKNCFNCFDCEFLEESKYCTDLKKGDKVSFKNHDISYFGLGIDFSYECSVGGYNANHTVFCENVWQGNDIFYSQLCMQSSNNLFGCIGLKHASYSILNKKYSKEEYEKMVPRIISHMCKDVRAHGASAQASEIGSRGSQLSEAELTNKEWGEFFPVSMSPFGYNETTAFECYPLEKESVIKKGWKWKIEKEPDYSGVTKILPTDQLPSDIGLVTDDILQSCIRCAESGKLFKIQVMELAFYRKMNLPLPKFHPDIRHFRRLALRRPRKLYKRPCAKCQAEIQTSFAPGCAEKVFCEKCYLAEIY